MTTTIVLTEPATTGTNGITTSWLPLTSPYTAPQGCFSTFLIHMSDTAIYAFNPNLGLNYATSIRCMPEYATVWWEQRMLGLTDTVYRLGPMRCPHDYTTVAVNTMNPFTTEIGCCPFRYGLVTFSADTIKPGQCTSTLPANQAFTYVTETSPSKFSLTSGSFTYPTIVTGLQVNGYIFNVESSLPTASTTLSTTTTTTSKPVSMLSSASPSTSAITNHVLSSSISARTVAGVAVAGVIFGLGVSCLLSWFILRRYRKEAITKAQHTVSQSQQEYPELSNLAPQELPNAERKHELQGGENAQELNG